jgi:hypothetical protein
MDKKAFERIKMIMALNQNAVPYRKMEVNKLDGQPKVIVDDSGFSIYDTVLMHFSTSLISEFETNTSEQCDELLDRAHRLTEAYFQRAYKTATIMNDITKEHLAKEKNKTASNLIVSK